jgi:hypothetical protein
MTQHEHHEKLLPRPLPADETLRSEKHTDGLWHARYETGLATLCGLPVLALTDFVAPPTCASCSTTARAIFRIDRSAPAWWFTTSGGAAIPSPVAPPEDCAKDAA